MLKSHFGNKSHSGGVSACSTFFGSLAAETAVRGRRSGGRLNRWRHGREPDSELGAAGP